MDSFRFALAKVFMSFKRTIGLALSYLSGLLICFIPLGIIYDEWFDNVILNFLLVIASIVGIIVIIDTVILQVKTYQ